MSDQPDTPKTRRAATDSGHSLKPYLAVVTLLVVVGVASFSLVERWLAEPPKPDQDHEAPIPGGGRLVIGETTQAEPAKPTEGSGPEDSGASFKPQEFTFYKSLGNTSQAPPKLEPKAPPEPRASAEPSPKPNDRVRSVTRKAYTVQIGSFQDRKAAERLAASVRHYQYTVSVTRVVLPDTGVRYRVRIGSFSAREDALKLAETLKKKHKKLEPFVALVAPPSTS